MGVIVRTKDRPYFLARALGDIAAQSFRDAEVVVVNDRGDREQVAATVAASPIADRVRIVDVAEPGGRCFAANTGIRETEAPYVVLHDDDDLWHPDFLARTVEYLDAHPNDGGVMVPTDIVYEKQDRGVWKEVSRAPFWAGMTSVTFLALLQINRAVPISFLYRRAIHDEIGMYDESLEAVEDWDLYLRISERFAIGFLEGDALAFWTQRPSGRGADGNSMFELSSAHRRDDVLVRDRALRSWSASNGPGLPLYIAYLHEQLRAEFTSELEARLDRQREQIVAEIYDRHPLWRRLRRIRSAFARSRRG